MSVFGTKADITLTECPLLGIVGLRQCPSRHIGGLLHKTSHRQLRHVSNIGVGEKNRARAWPRDHRCPTKLLLNGWRSIVVAVAS